MASGLCQRGLLPEGVPAFAFDSAHEYDDNFDKRLLRDPLSIPLFTTCQLLSRHNPKILCAACPILTAHAIGIGADEDRFARLCERLAIILNGAIMKNLFDDDDDYVAGQAAAIDYAATNIPNTNVSPWDEEWLEEGARAGLRPFYEAFAEFLSIDVASGDATQDTIRAYHREVVYWVKWCEEWNVQPARAKRGDVERYREQLKIQGAAVTTRSHKLSIIRRFYDAAVKHGLLEVNPAATVRGGKDLTPPEEKIKALTRGSLIDLLASIPTGSLLGARDRAIIALMAVHGLRRIEVHRLDHAHIEAGGEATALVVHGKGNRMRRVFLRDDTLAAVVAYVEAKSQRGLPLNGALFLSQSNRTGGQRLSRRGLNFVVDGYLNPLGLKRVGVSCHSLRHTHGTLAVSGGAKIEQLRDAMGHSKIETTSIYVRAVERVKNNPANFIDVEV